MYGIKHSKSTTSDTYDYAISIFVVFLNYVVFYGVCALVCNFNELY